MSRPLVIFLVTLLLSLTMMAVLWMTDVPFGVSGEWEWGRVPSAEIERWDLVFNGLLLLIAGGVHAGIVWMGASRMESARWWSRCGWLMGLTIAGFGWLFAVQLSPPEGYGIEKSAHVLYYQSSSGYFHEARYRKESLREYLANYEEDIQSEDPARRVLHHGTHPPGLFTCYRGLIRLCESSPKLVDWILQSQPASVVAMFKEIDSRPKPMGQSLRDTDRAVIWLATMLTQLCGAGVVVPLFFLGRGIASARSAWIASAFWPLIPALAIFLPKSDVLMAFLGTLFLAAWWSGWRRKCFLRCFLAGVLFWLGMMISLALLPVAFLAGLMVLWDVVFGQEDRKLSQAAKDSWPVLLAGLAGFLLPAILMGWLASMNVFAVWWQNYQNHAEFYRHFPRSYWAWFWFNPVETLFALGVPVCVLLIVALTRHGTDRKSASRSSAGPDIAFVVTMTVLWISGKNRGEAARLWLVVFPYFLWISARFWKPPTSADAASQRSLLLPMLVLQMLVCWLTVLRVNGFPFPL